MRHSLHSINREGIMKRKLLHALILISATHSFAFGAAHQAAPAPAFCPDVLNAAQIKELKDQKRITFTHNGFIKHYNFSGIGSLPTVDFRLGGLTATKHPHQNDAICTYEFRHFGRTDKGSFVLSEHIIKNVETLQDAFDYMGLHPNCTENNFKLRFLRLVENRYGKKEVSVREGHQAEDKAFNLNLAKANKLIKEHFMKYYEEHKNEEGKKASGGNVSDQQARNKAFENLGLKNTATFDEVKKAYYLLAKKYHPDKNPDNPDAEVEFKKVGEAYQLLTEHFNKKSAK